MKDDLYKDGPLKEDGTWSPRGGSELYFHSHLSEPDEGLDSDGLAEPIDARLLKLARAIIKARRQEHEADLAGAEAELATRKRLESVVALFRALPQGEDKKSVDMIEIKSDGTAVLRLAAGGEQVIQTGGS